MTKLSDLSTSALANAGVFLHLVHPVDADEKLFSDDKKEKPVGFTMMGQDSDTCIAVNNANTDKALNPKTDKKAYTAAATERQGAETIAALVTEKDWNIPQGWIDGTDDDTPSTFSRENVLKMLLNPGVKWVREQANRFAGTRANFLKA